MKTLYLMRHGQTEFNVQKIVQGQCDSPLTTAGKDQAREAALKLRNAVFAPIASWLLHWGVPIEPACLYATFCASR